MKNRRFHLTFIQFHTQSLLLYPSPLPCGRSSASGRACQRGRLQQDQGAANLCCRYP